MKRKKRKELEESEKTKSIKMRLKKLLPDFIAIMFFAVLLAVFGILREFEHINEFMVTKVSRNILMVMGRATSAFPFSMYELFLYIVIFAVIFNIVRILVYLVKRRLIKALSVFMSVTLTALIISSIYFVSAGFSYTRHEEYFPVYNPPLTRQQTVMVADYFIDDFNALADQFERDKNGYAIMPYTVNELSDKVRTEYLRHTGYNINKYTPKCKTILTSSIMSEMNVLGVFFAPFGEANVNANLPAFSLPFTMAHETAHAKGVMLEDAADQLALYITLTSKDPFIRYSGYSEMIFTLLDAVWTYDSLEGYADYPEYNRLVAKINPLIRNDWASTRAFWEKYDRMSKINKLFDKIYDNYLKLMGQKEGTSAYIPPDTGVIEQPVIDPDTGPVINPDTGKPEVILKPGFTVIQQIFFQAYKEAVGEIN